MLNLINASNRRVEVKVSAPVASGAITRSGGLVGIPVEHAVANETIAFIRSGIVAMTFDLQGTIGAGSYLYWDVTAALLSLGAGVGDVEVGQVLGSHPSGATGLYLVDLKIGFPRAAAGNAQDSVG